MEVMGQMVERQIQLDMLGADNLKSITCSKSEQYKSFATKAHASHENLFFGKRPVAHKMSQAVNATAGG